MNENEAAVEAHVRNALQEAVQMTDVMEPEDKGPVTRWVVIAEVMGVDGERGLWTSVSGTMATWDTMGMLEWALENERNFV